jgi:hypothetical protein
MDRDHDRTLKKTTYLIRVDIYADRKIRKDILVRYLLNGLEHSKTGRLGYEVTVYEDFDLISEPASGDGDTVVRRPAKPSP